MTTVKKNKNKNKSYKSLCIHSITLQNVLVNSREGYLGYWKT